MNKLLIVGLLVCGLGLAQAQEAPYGVWVTTQDNMALRLGPGRNWEQLATVPFGQTLPAIGRSADGQWVQVQYTGPLLEDASTIATRDGLTAGWLNRDYLVWTGPLLGLPLDGQSAVPLARRSNPTFLATPGCCYEGRFVPERPATDITESVEVELIGQVGTREKWYWVQFQLNGKTYWARSQFSLGLPEPQEIGYNRLITQTYETVARINQVDADIGGRWNNLAQGFPTSCNAIPDPVAFKSDAFQPGDLASEPTFRPAYLALVAARDAVNQAIALFEAQCAQQGRQVAPETISQALTLLDEARLNLEIVNRLQLPYQSETPIYGD